MDVTCASPSVVTHWGHLDTGDCPQGQNHPSNYVIPASSIVLDIAEAPGGKRAFVYLSCLVTVGRVDPGASHHLESDLSTQNMGSRPGQDAVQTVGTQSPSAQS